jgi:hypothetical protein
MRGIAIVLLLSALNLRADWVVEQKNFICYKYKVLVGNSAINRIWWDARDQRRDKIADFASDTFTYVDHVAKTYSRTTIAEYVKHLPPVPLTENHRAGKKDNVAGVDCTWYSFSTNRVARRARLHTIGEGCFARAISMPAPFDKKLADYLDAEDNRRGGLGFALLLRVFQPEQNSFTYETTKVTRAAIDPSEFQPPPGFVEKPMAWIEP